MRRSHWLLAWGLGLAALAPPVEAVACEGGNVLVNPGGEAGPDPWEYVNLGSRHQVGAVTFSTGSVGATEGDAWFAGERTETAVGIGTAPLRVEQAIDVRGPRPVECIRLEADFFGVGEILAGSGTTQAIFTLRFASETFGPFSLASPFQTLGVQVETTDVPPGTAFAVARMQGQMNLSSSVGGVPVTGRVILGADDAAMSITLPEPTASLGGIVAWWMLIGLAGRRRGARAAAHAA